MVSKEPGILPFCARTTRDLWLVCTALENDMEQVSSKYTIEIIGKKKKRLFCLLSHYYVKLHSQTNHTKFLALIWLRSYFSSQNTVICYLLRLLQSPPRLGQDIQAQKSNYGNKRKPAWGDIINVTWPGPCWWEDDAAGKREVSQGQAGNSSLWTRMMRIFHKRSFVRGCVSLDYIWLCTVENLLSCKNVQN